ncbi:hypothetical protein SERLA73DRAFT_182298 [Serpula lacrymans var. lacrymans S7.3]|uniref:Uncharacterized protein n=1 Tax=Serpula lacrymans var. lacrymans (strain S7.3) TaxID=936435 RepID=F8PX74_SERL3|nr:hypothetical protein SERLA73DRAFT_182298 [Serpula lacrymans var. lacrymans S7.3]
MVNVVRLSNKGKKLTVCRSRSDTEMLVSFGAPPENHLAFAASLLVTSPSAMNLYPVCSLTESTNFSRAGTRIVLNSGKTKSAIFWSTTSSKRRHRWARETT